ncbi:hypothetical protein EV363DRAFT_1173633 [Boletus edulis]|uniref:Uncharacterized protein n=1 Tax=Boletus edulis BED1 TaxID=1328754 RepID=A0AAD4GNI1_BOLED|nr:hypothetical protein EV363DRAFT_1173633 [Boletus edulis]KAF8452754.1 hypothetical protein L210DRAFT_3639227 [Boletus edulis BED1]
MYTKIGDVEGAITYVLSLWAYAIFWMAADMIMVLRVYAMYNRSRFILSILLMVYITEVVVLFVGASIYSDPNYAIVSIFQVLDVTICTVMISTATWNNASVILPFILGAVLCTLVVAHFVRESLQMYRVTKRWQLNRYTNLLVRDGLLYFFATFFNSLINLLGALGILSQEWVQPVLLSASTIVLYTLAPRFVINLRELYVRDTQGRLDRDIDTAFGLSSGVRRGVGGTTTIGTIAFVHGTSEDGEEMTTTAERAEGGGRRGSVV